MGPSSTMGVTIPSRRNPAVKVVVFQCPWGTAARQHSPRLARPRSRVILLDAPFGAVLGPVAHTHLTIDKDALLGVKVGLAIEPEFAPGLHIRAFLFSCMRSLF